MANKKDEEKKAEETAEQTDEQAAPPAETDQTPPATEEEAAPADQPSSDTVVKRGFGRVKIPGFRGSFKDAKFDDDGVCEQISQETFNDLVQQFPKAEITDAEGLE